MVQLSIEDYVQILSSRDSILDKDILESFLIHLLETEDVNKTIVLLCMRYSGYCDLSRAIQTFIREIGVFNNQLEKSIKIQSVVNLIQKKTSNLKRNVMDSFLNLDSLTPDVLYMDESWMYALVRTLSKCSLKNPSFNELVNYYVQHLPECFPLLLDEYELKSICVVRRTTFLKVIHSLLQQLMSRTFYADNAYLSEQMTQKLVDISCLTPFMLIDASFVLQKTQSQQYAASIFLKLRERISDKVRLTCNKTMIYLDMSLRGWSLKRETREIVESMFNPNYDLTTVLIGIEKYLKKEANRSNKHKCIIAFAKSLMIDAVICTSIDHVHETSINRTIRNILQELICLENNDASKYDVMIDTNEWSIILFQQSSFYSLNNTAPKTIDGILLNVARSMSFSSIIIKLLNTQLCRKAKIDEDYDPTVHSIILHEIIDCWVQLHEDVFNLMQRTLSLFNMHLHAGLIREVLEIFVHLIVKAYDRPVIQLMGRLCAEKNPLALQFCDVIWPFLTREYQCLQQDVPTDYIQQNRWNQNWNEAILREKSVKKLSETFLELEKNTMEKKT